MLTSIRTGKDEVPIAVKRILRNQRGGADRPPDDMHDGQRLQSAAGNDRSIHEVCGSCSLHNGLSGRDM